MNFLFFDCETNGLPTDYKASYQEFEKWPRVISLAWILADEQQAVINREHHLIMPDGWEIPKEKFWTDGGFSTEKSMMEGEDIGYVLSRFLTAKDHADVLVAHNLNFDHRIVWAEIVRSGRTPRSGMHKICTMQSSTKFCGLPGKNGKGLKWPKLQELHQVLFGCDFEGAHDASADIAATFKCFYELVARGVITLPAAAQTPAHA